MGRFAGRSPFRACLTELMPLRAWFLAGRESLATLQEVLAGRGRLLPGFVLFSFMVLGAWYLYVPLHELLHAAGCALAGGRVVELQIHPFHGGRLLQRLFPFVVAKGGAAGRLTGFDTGESDVVYLLTDFAPFLLSVLGVFPLLRRARATGSLVSLATATVLTFALVVSIPGDLYEMGSILVSRAMRLLSLVPVNGTVDLIRSDDLGLLLSEFGRRFPTDRVKWGVAVAAALAIGVFIGNAILAASRLLMLFSDSKTRKQAATVVAHDN
jgi:hypothetical protein